MPMTTRAQSTSDPIAGKQNEQSEQTDMSMLLKNISQKLEKLDSIDKTTREIKSQVDTQTGLIAALTSRITELEDDVSKKQEAIERLQFDNSNKDDQIAKLSTSVNELEFKIDALEQYSKRENLVITGLRIEPFATAVKTGINDGGDETNESEDAAANQLTESLGNRVNPRDKSIMSQNFADFARARLGIGLMTREILDIHPLGRKDANGHTDKRPIIVRFNNRQLRDQVYRARTKLKGTRMFINEQLTPRNAEIAKAARDLKSKRLVRNTWTKNCQVLVQLNDGNTVMARSISHLNEIVK